MRVSLLMGMESSFTRAESLALNLLTYGRAIPVSESLARVEAVDGTSLARVAARLRTAPPTVTALGPIRSLPSYNTIAERCAA